MTNSVATPWAGAVVFVFNPSTLTWALKVVTVEENYVDPETPGFGYSGEGGFTTFLLMEGYGVSWLHEHDPLPTDMKLCLDKWNELHEVA